MSIAHSNIAPSLRISLLAAAVLALSACSTVVPTPLAAKEIQEVNRADQQAMRQDVEPVKGPLTLDEALARALKYNLDRRAKQMEEALALNQLDVTRYDMLPRLMGQMNWASRSNDSISVSLDPTTGLVSDQGFISQDRSHHLTDLGLTWNLLDFGLGYYGSRQQAHRVLIASERRRKAMHLLMQDVRTAYWRAASAQKLRKSVQETIALGEEALADARKVEEERVRNPVEALRYQRQLLENLRLLEAINQELLSAQVDMASLINAPLGTPITIADDEVSTGSNLVTQLPIERLEEVALRNNPDLLEQHYNAKVAREETRKTITRMFPNVSFSYGIKYDSDSYLINRNWNEAGLQLSFNFMNLLTGPTQIKLAEAGVALADQRRMATQMAVMTQLHLARLQVINARSQFERAEQVYATDVRLSELMRNRAAVQASSKLERVSNDTSAILSLLRRYQALAQVQTAESRLLAQLGVEPKIGSSGDMSLAELTNQIKSQNNPWANIKSNIEAKK
jgi:outer membrane protein TolC